MKITLSAAFLIALATPIMAGENDVTLTLGKFSIVGKRALQYVTAKNNGSEMIPLLRIECGFLKGTELLALGNVLDETSSNVAPGQTAYLQVGANNSDSVGADHVDCRVVTPAQH